MRRIARFFALVLLASSLFACARKHATAPVVTPVPVADSPRAAVRLYFQGLASRDPAACLRLLTDDYTFVFAANDSSGAPFRTTAWGRLDETSSLEHLFTGGSSSPVAADFQATIDNALVPMTDTRPGKDPDVHKAVSTSLMLRVTFDRNGTPDVWVINGRALLYVVRGDSAAIGPERLASEGSPAGRWYVSGYEDQTAGNLAPGFHADPTRSYSWGSLKAAYR